MSQLLTHIIMRAKGNSLGIVKRYLFESIGAAKYPNKKDMSSTTIQSIA